MLLPALEDLVTDRLAADSGGRGAQARYRLRLALRAKVLSGPTQIPHLEAALDDLIGEVAAHRAHS